MKMNNIQYQDVGNVRIVKCLTGKRTKANGSEWKRMAFLRDSLTVKTQISRAHVLRDPSFRFQISKDYMKARDILGSVLKPKLPLLTYFRFSTLQRSNVCFFRPAHRTLVNCMRKYCILLGKK